MATDNIPYRRLRKITPNSFKYQMWKLNLKRKNQWEKYRKLKEWHDLPHEEAIALQSNRLLSIVRHALTTVPYYRTKFETGQTKIEDFTLDQFSEFPILTKSELRSNYDNLLSESADLDESYENRTGGSTGQPVRIRQNKTYLNWNLASKQLFNEWAGRKPGQTRMKLWGSERDVTNSKSSIRGSIGRFLENTIVLDCFTMSSETMSQYTSWINELNPKMILAYVDGIHQLSDFIERNGLQLHSPDAIMTSAGTLFPDMREKIESVFECRVYNRYGTREVGDMACEQKPGNGLQVNFPLHYIEIVDDDGYHVDEGEEGEILVTSLTNYTMPLIRYKIGDLATPQNIEMGNIPHTLKLNNVTGRTGDALKTENDEIISTVYFIHSIGVLLEPNWIDSFQIIQHQIGEIEVLISPIENERLADHDADLRDIRLQIHRVMGDSCTVNITEVDQIQKSTSGKFRYTKSHV